MALEPLTATLYDTETGTYLRRIPVVAAPWSKEIGGWGKFEVSVARTPSANLPLLRALAQPWRTLVVLRRGNRVIQGGPVTGRPFGKRLVLKCEGFGAIYRKRLVLNRLLRGMTVDGEVLIDEDNPAPEWVLKFTGSYVDIAAALIEETQDWRALPVTTPPTQGGNRLRTYYGYDFAKVEQRLLELMRLEDGPELRFTEELVPGGVVFNFEGAPELVTHHHRWNTSLPGDRCTIGQMDDDGADMATEMWFLGGKNDDILLATRGDDGFTRLANRNLFPDPRFNRPEAWTFHNVLYRVDEVVPGRVEDIPHRGIHLSSPSAQDSFAYLSGESNTAFQFGMTPGVWEFSAEGSVREYFDDELPPEIDAVDTGMRSRARSITVHVWDTALNSGAGGYVIWHSPQVPNVEGSQVRVSVRVGIPETATGAFVRFYHGAMRGEITWSQPQLSHVDSWDPDTRWSDYFWGGKPSTFEYEYGWEGTPDASPSYRRIRDDAPEPMQMPLLQEADTSHTTVSEIQTLRQHLRGAMIRNARTQEVIDVHVSAEEAVLPGDWADVRTNHPLYGEVVLPLKVVGVSGDMGPWIKLACRIRNGEEIE